MSLLVHRTMEYSWLEFEAKLTTIQAARKAVKKKK